MEITECRQAEEALIITFCFVLKLSILIGHHPFLQKLPNKRNKSKIIIFDS